MRLPVVFALALFALPAWAQAPSRPPDPPPVAAEDRVPPPPSIRDLGGERYAIGPIVVDRKSATFTVAGRILETGAEMPLEFIVTAHQGTKSYESLIELEADAYQFNVACILIGLVRHPEEQPRRHFDPKPVAGDQVAVVVEWTKDGAMRRENASNLIRVGGQKTAVDDWVYTGSVLLPNGHFLAHLAGALVGFVHDMDSVIQHRTGYGLGNYGSVTLDPDVAPPAGTPVTLTVGKVSRP